MNPIRSLALFGLLSLWSGIAVPTAAQTPQMLIAQVSAEDFFYRGVEKLGAGDLPGAIADHTEAIRLNPNDAVAYTNRGVARRKSEDLVGAIADYTEAIRLNPNYAEAYTNRGVARAASGDLVGAKSDLQQAAILFEQQGNEAGLQAVMNLLERLQ